MEFRPFQKIHSSLKGYKNGMVNSKDFAKNSVKWMVQEKVRSRL